MSREEFKHYTPVEFQEIFDAKIKNRRMEWEFADMRTARICEVIAKCAGNSDAKPDDFLILSREIEDREPDTAESLADKLQVLTRSLGGTVINRG